MAKSDFPLKKQKTNQYAELPGNILENFESKMNRFLKDSEDRLASLKKHTESSVEVEVLEEDSNCCLTNRFLMLLS